MGAKIFMYNKGRPGPSTGFGSVCGGFRISFGYVPCPCFFCCFPVKGLFGKAGSWGGNGGHAPAGSPAASETGCSEGLSRAMGCTKCRSAAPYSWGNTTVARFRCPQQGPGPSGAFLRHFCTEGVALRETGQLRAGPALGQLWGTGFTTGEAGAM